MTQLNDQDSTSSICIRFNIPQIAHLISAPVKRLYHTQTTGITQVRILNTAHPDLGCFTIQRYRALKCSNTCVINCMFYIQTTDIHIQDVWFPLSYWLSKWLPMNKTEQLNCKNIHFLKSRHTNKLLNERYVWISICS